MCCEYASAEVFKCIYGYIGLCFVSKTEYFMIPGISNGSRYLPYWIGRSQVAVVNVSACAMNMKVSVTFYICAFLCSYSDLYEYERFSCAIYERATACA